MLFINQSLYTISIGFLQKLPSGYLLHHAQVSWRQKPRTGLCFCTSFVLQMFSRMGPQALPGTAFQGIIPEIPQQKKPLILAMNTRFLFLSHLFHPLASCVAILGTRTLTSTAFESAGGIKTTRSSCAFLPIPRLPAKTCSQMWFSHMAAKWLVGFLHLRSSHTLPALPLSTGRDHLHLGGTWHLSG